MSYEPASHYDRVTDAWTLLLGDELHYGIFEHPDEDLVTATHRLTERMTQAGRIEPGNTILDVGCGTGTQASRLARAYGARVTGITTSEAGIQAARKRAAAEGTSGLITFEQRDGMANGFDRDTFDRVWALESSHLMRDRDRLIAECARVLRPGGRLVLCDIMLQRRLAFTDVRRLREPLALLRNVFGDARMEPLGEYERLAQVHGLIVDPPEDLTLATEPTFARWRENAHRHRNAVTALLGPEGWQQFIDSCEVLEGFWDDGTLGYGLLAASKP